RRMERAVNRRMERGSSRHSHLVTRLERCQPRVLEQRYTVDKLGQALHRSTIASIRQKRSRLVALSQTLEALGPRSVLDRGYSITRDAQGKIRSEEHTSELQSRENLVCRLLLEKKK